MTIATPPPPSTATVSDTTVATATMKAIDPAVCDRTADDIKLQKQQAAAWRAYFGAFRDSVDVEPRKRDRNVKSNRCAAIVDKGAAWLAGPGLEIEVADKGAPPKAAKAKSTKKQPPPRGGNTNDATADGQQPEPESDPRQDWLDAFIGNPDDFKTFLLMVYKTGGVTGHAYVKLVYDETTRQQYPRYTILDSEHVWVLTDPDDCNSAVVYCIEFESDLRILGAGGQQQTLVKRQVICRCSADGTPRYGVMDRDGNLPPGVGEYDDTSDIWTIATYTRTTMNAVQGGAWKQIGATITWPFPFAPIVDTMNLAAPKQYAGLPDLPPEIIALNEKLNDVQTDTAVTLEQYSMPQPWANGYGNVDQIEAKPGAILLLPQGAQTGVLQPRGDIVSNRDFANDLRADMDEQSRVPAVALGRQESLPKGNLSGVALELLFQPLVEKTNEKRGLYGKLIRELCLRALIITGQATRDDTEIRLHWGNLLPKDDAAAAQMALAMSQVGTSEHAIDDILGLDYDTEADYKRDEAHDQLTAFARGQGMPPTNDPMQMPADEAQAQPGQAPNGSMPPVNHPQAVAARQTMQAAMSK